jgi:hypothetical protein
MFCADDGHAEAKAGFLAIESNLGPDYFDVRKIFFTYHGF